MEKFFDDKRKDVNRRLHTLHLKNTVYLLIPTRFKYTKVIQIIFTSTLFDIDQTE